MENILVEVDKFKFPTNFVILNIEKDKDVPIIIGWPFLAIRRTLIDVATGELIIRVNDEQVVFNVFKTMGYPKTNDDYFIVNIIELEITEV